MIVSISSSCTNKIEVSVVSVVTLEAFSLVVRADKVPIKIFAGRLGAHRNRKKSPPRSFFKVLLPGKQCRFRRQSSTYTMVFVMLRLQELGRAENTLLYMCFNTQRKRIARSTAPFF